MELLKKQKERLYDPRAAFLKLLEEIQPDADFENCDTLIDDGILDSFAILSIVSELQDTYDITITPADIIPENFNSAKALWDMVCRLKG